MIGRGGRSRRGENTVSARSRSGRTSGKLASREYSVENRSLAPASRVPAREVSSECALSRVIVRGTRRRWSVRKQPRRPREPAKGRGSGARGLGPATVKNG